MSKLYDKNSALIKDLFFLPRGGIAGGRQRQGDIDRPVQENAAIGGYPPQTLCRYKFVCPNIETTSLRARQTVHICSQACIQTRIDGRATGLQVVVAVVIESLKTIHMCAANFIEIRAMEIISTTASIEKGLASAHPIEAKRRCLKAMTIAHRRSAS